MSRREHLQKLILRRLLLYGRTTRPELVALTGCRAATVFEAIDALKASGMVVEPERRGKRTGRRAPELECCREFAYFLGVDLGRGGMIGVVTDCCGDILEAYEKRFDAPLSAPEAAYAEIARCVSELRRNIGEKWRLVRGAGLAVPEATDAARAAGERLAGELGVPAEVRPGRTVRTVMEYLSRLPDAPESLFFMNTGNAIEGGFMTGGKPFVGADGLEMNIGHIVADRDGEICSCGNRGCLEASAGGPAILNMVRRMLRDGVATELTEADLTLRRFVECARRDKAARMIAEKVAGDIGHALATAIALLDPETVVIGGELAGLGELLLDAVRRVLELECFPGVVGKLKLELSALEPEDTARGAAIMIRDRVFGIEGPPERPVTPTRR